MKLIYLDQEDISDIAKGRARHEDAAELQRLVDAGQVAVVVAPTHAVEAALCSDVVLRERVVDFVDGLKSRLWLRHSEWILRKEVERWFQEEITGKPASAAVPFTSNILEFYGLTSPLQVKGGWDTEHEFRTMVSMWLRRGAKGLRKIREQKAVWPALSSQSRMATKGCTPSGYALNGRVWSYLPTQTPSGIFLSHRSRQQYARRLNLARCPALALLLQVEDKLHSDTASRAGTGDILDCMHLCAVPYCDMATLDARMYSIVLQTAAGKAYLGRLDCKLRNALVKLSHGRHQGSHL
jgi:hypothetical protein